MSSQAQQITNNNTVNIIATIKVALIESYINETEIKNNSIVSAHGDVFGRVWYAKQVSLFPRATVAHQASAGV